MWLRFLNKIEANRKQIEIQQFIDANRNNSVTIAKIENAQKKS